MKGFSPNETRFAMCLYDLGLLLILPIDFMVEPQFHHGIRAGCPHVKPNDRTRSTSSSCCSRSCPTLMRDKVCYVLI
ncbi:unnamed protein product [Malus baccata var. baccata]